MSCFLKDYIEDVEGHIPSIFQKSSVMLRCQMYSLSYTYNEREKPYETLSNT